MSRQCRANSLSLRQNISLGRWFQLWTARFCRVPKIRCSRKLCRLLAPTSFEWCRPLFVILLISLEMSYMRLSANCRGSIVYNATKKHSLSAFDFSSFYFRWGSQPIRRRRCSIQSKCRSSVDFCPLPSPIWWILTPWDAPQGLVGACFSLVAEISIFRGSNCAAFFCPLFIVYI